MSFADKEDLASWKLEGLLLWGSWQLAALKIH